MDALFEGSRGNALRGAVFAVVVLLALFLGIKAFGEFKGLRYIGAGLPPTNTIYVSGYGEAVGVPDIATFTFSVVSERQTVAAAQEDATAKANAITAYLAEAGVAEKDIQTSSYSVYPQYDYIQAVCTADFCPPGRQQLRGYEVRQTTVVKVRDTAKAGELLSGVGSRGATEVSGLSFTFDDPDALQIEARDKAIADAKEKAESLARALGVRLVRIVSFNENGGYPIPFAKDMSVGMGGSEAESRPAAPPISTGENKVVSNITVTYEIR